MKRRIVILLSAAALAAVTLVPGTQASASAEKRAQTEEYVPFATDFPKPARAPAPAASASGIDWSDVGVGGGIVAAFVALLAGSGIVLTRRATPARS